MPLISIEVSFEPAYWSSRACVQALGKERAAAPRLIGPAADADPDLSRRCLLCSHVEPSICARPRLYVRRSVRRDPTGVRRKTAFGVPAAAQISSKPSTDSSMRTIGWFLWPTGGTPPIAKPVASRTKSASARAIGSPIAAAAFFSSTRSTPEAMIKTARPLVAPRKISDFAICATSQPIAAAASAAVRVLASNSRTSNRSPSAA